MLVFLSLFGCASEPVNPQWPDLPQGVVAEPFEVGGLVILNRTPRSLEQVQILVPATGDFISCGNIIGGRECATTFPERQYRGNALVVSWWQDGQEWTVGPFVINVSDSLDTGETVYAEVFVIGPGSAGARFFNRDSPY